jgi:hypothetical protein
MPPDRLANLCLLDLAHTFGDHLLSWGEDKENGPFGNFAPPRILKKCTDNTSSNQISYILYKLRSSCVQERSVYTAFAERF